MDSSVLVNTYAGNPIDRASAHRADVAWLAARLADPEAWSLAFWNGSPLVDFADGAVRLVRLPVRLARSLADTEQDLLFLGLEGERPVFAVDLDGPADPAEGPLEGFGAFRGLRELTPDLDPVEAAEAATGRAVFEWRRRHRFCSACGQPSLVVDGGWRRQCPACATDHFPRTDPVVIMLPLFGERCLLGRSAAWDPGRYSALAGFMEPGESIEEACAREVAEEAGLTVRAVRYHSSQPWPYPSNLMIGLFAEVTHDRAAPDQTELEAARWFTREEARDLLDGRIEGLSAPPRFAIAHSLLRAWSADPLILESTGGHADRPSGGNGW
jgi:NAD+ diphosphatase